MGIHDRHRRDADSVSAWGGGGFGLLVDSLSNLFKGKDPEESWGDYVITKVGLILMILFGLGMIAIAVGIIYLKVLH